MEREIALDYARRIILASVAHRHTIAAEESVKSKRVENCFKIDLDVMSSAINENRPVVATAAPHVGERLTLKSFIIKGSMMDSATYWRLVAASSWMQLNERSSRSLSLEPNMHSLYTVFRVRS